MQLLPPASRPAWGVLAAVAAGVAADIAMDPQRRHVPLCPFKAVTGQLCPLCGGLRAVDFAVHGDPALAWHSNALVWLLAPVLALGWVRWVWTGSPPRLDRTAVIAVAVMAVAFAVLRNAIPSLGLLPPA